MNYASLVKAINSATAQLQGRAAAAVNQALVIRNWMVGSRLVEYEQKGSDRARYGAALLPRLARDLKARGIRGLDERTLLDCRAVYRIYPQIPGTLSPELQAARSERRIPGTLSPESTALVVKETAPGAQPAPLRPEELREFSWSQLQEFVRIDDPWRRAFYENECLKGRWSVRQLQRQIESLLYERTGLSANKRAVVERARRQAPQETIADLLRDPYVLEFTGLADRADYSEERLETVLLDHLQRFLLELGRGFCFEARQFRMTQGRRHHRVDLVFYHRMLRCHVLFDLKVRAFQPADAGQMNFYVNWFKAHMMAPGDAPPVGILLCSDKDGAEVEFATAGMDQKLFVTRYLTALPPAEKLRAFLEADRDRIESLAPRAPAKTKRRGARVTAARRRARR